MEKLYSGPRKGKMRPYGKRSRVVLNSLLLSGSLDVKKEPGDAT